MYSVYRIENSVNGKNYIGITSRSPEERFVEHLSRCRNNHRGSRLYVAMRKYGPQKFSVELLATTDSDGEIRVLEGVFIRKYDSYENGYNCNYGGHGNLDVSDDTRKKMGDGRRGIGHSEESRRRISLGKKGDKRCPKNLGDFVLAGSDNPKAKSWLVQFPDGHIETVCGIRQFGRDNNVVPGKLVKRGRSKGFVLLERFNDYPGNGSTPKRVEARAICKSTDEDIVWSHGQL